MRPVGWSPYGDALTIGGAIEYGGEHMLNAYDVVTNGSRHDVVHAFHRSITEQPKFFSKWLSSAERKRGVWSVMDGDELRSLASAIRIDGFDAGGRLGNSLHLVLKVFEEDGMVMGRHILLIDGSIPSGVNPIADRLGAHAKKTAKVLKESGKTAKLKRRLRI